MTTTTSPILRRTSAGVISAMLTSPDTKPVATAVIVQGWGGTRAGINRMWRLLAEDLAGAGIATLRTDYAGMGESWDARIWERVEGVNEVVQWYCDSRPGTPLLLVAHCFGLSPALLVSSTQENVIAAALIIPPLFPEVERSAPRLGRRLVGQARARLGALRRLPVRAAYRLRYGRPRTWPTDLDAAEPREELTELVRQVPTWMLVGEHDVCLAPTQQLLPELHAAGRVELETVDGLRLRSLPTPESQAVIRSRVVHWARGVVAQHVAQ